MRRLPDDVPQVEWNWGQKRTLETKIGKELL